jgi:hypothetical protein
MQDGIDSKQQATANLPDAANMALTLFTRALKEETGLDYRSPGKALLIGQGAIHVQVPSADVAQALASSVMVLRIMPTKTEWSRWSEMGSQYQFRDYDMGLAQFPTLAQRRAGDGGPIVEASQVSLRVGLKFGRGQCRHAQASSGNTRPAAVAVMSDTLPRKHLIRAWSQTYLQGIWIGPTEQPSSGNTENPSTPCQPDVNGPQVAVPLLIPDIIRAAMGQEEHGGVPSGGTQGASRSGPELMRTFDVTSMLGGGRVLNGGGAGREQPGASVPLGSPPRRSLNLGGRVRFNFGYF